MAQRSSSTANCLKRNIHVKIKLFYTKKAFALTGSGLMIDWELEFGVVAVRLLSLCYDGLESLGVVDSEVSEHLAVDLDTCLVQQTHQL